MGLERMRHLRRALLHRNTRLQRMGFVIGYHHHPHIVTRPPCHSHQLSDTLRPLQFRLPRCQNSSSKLYLIISTITYHLLLFGGAHLQCIGQLQVTLRVFRDLNLCHWLEILLSLWNSLRYLVSHLHVLNAYRNIVWSRRIFLLVRLNIILCLIIGHNLLTYGAICRLLNFGPVVPLLVLKIHAFGISYNLLSLIISKCI